MRCLEMAEACYPVPTAQRALRGVGSAWLNLSRQCRPCHRRHIHIDDHDGEVRSRFEAPGDLNRLALFRREFGYYI